MTTQLNRRRIQPGLACATICLAVWLMGQRIPLSGEEFLGPATQQGSPRMLVLHDGRIVTGFLTPLELGYAVDLPNGRITVPFDAVICEAATLPEAYRKQREAITKPTAEQHTRLANWCIQQKLYEEAERELQSALQLQPSYTPARKMVARLRPTGPKDTDFTHTPEKKQLDDLLIARTFNDVQPIGGLSAPLARDFVTKIEPLLLNSCANTSCHGTAGKNKFHLTHKWNARGNTQHITDQNLQAALAQLDRITPENSPLIAQVRGPHGPAGIDVFRGTRSRELRALLEQWAVLSARHLGPPPGSQRTPNPIQQASFEQAAGTPAPALQPPHPATAAPPPEPPVFVPDRSAQPLPTGKNLVNEVRHEQARDPFNPAIFNQRVHGRK